MTPNPKLRELNLQASAENDGLPSGMSSLASSEKKLIRDRQDASLTLAIFVVVCLILLCLIGLLGFSLYFQHNNYSNGVLAALRGQRSDHNSIITYSRAWDFAVVKTSSLFLAFMLIFVGALYVLRVSESRYGFTLEGKEVKGSLETSSPGLVMVTLGVVLVGLVIYSKSLVDYRPSSEAIGESPVSNDVPQSTGDIKSVPKNPTPKVNK
jgi:hypothetical protein